MRKKQNYQRTDYAQNGELLCFGLSEHSLTEHLPRLSEKAKKDLDLIQSWRKNSNDEALARPAFRSDKTYPGEFNSGSLWVCSFLENYP